MEASKSILRQYWGFDEFRPPQDLIIDSVLQHKDTLALLPTGGGKSLCFQVPALIFEGKTLVISPLIALMQDQVDGLIRRNIKAKSLNANLSFRDIDRLLDNFAFGDLKILYVSPERISSEIFMARIARTKLSLIAVDEAHCISQWGYDFRPAYFNIPKLREIHPNVPMIALTATATPKVITDIVEKLELQKPAIFKKSFTRENLGFAVINTDDKHNELIRILQKMKGTAIIYVRNRKQTLEMALWLQQHQISCTSYHGGMEKSHREQNQDAWMTNKVRLMVSTNAFGMGIDKPDVRLVVHMDVAPSLEEYYQEAGRAGRDGKESYAIAILDGSDLTEAISQFNDQFPELDIITQVYDKLCRYFKVAYGAGFLESYDFEILPFANFLNLPVKKVYHILNVLEKEAWIGFSEAYKEPSKIQILVDHHDLEFIDHRAAEKTTLVNYILRNYEGLFNDFVRIDETKIANDLKQEEAQIIKTLQILKAEGIIGYHPRTSAPQVTFLKERPELSSFSIDKKSYLLRKKMAEDRLEAILGYMQNENKCRQKWIVDYFGEKGADCEKCDICLGKNDATLSAEQQQMLLEHLLNTLQIQSIDIKKYAAIYPFNKRKRIISAIQEFENSSLIRIDNSGKIWKK